MQDHNGLEATIDGFFERARFAGLLLPDGWFGGRPMDTLLRLTLLAIRPKRLILELDDQLLLSFIGPDILVEESTSELAMTGGTAMLVIAGFRHCTFEWLGYGSDAPHLQSYHGGRVCFVAPHKAS
jgi:hypothetical protein